MKYTSMIILVGMIAGCASLPPDLKRLEQVRDIGDDAKTQAMRCRVICNDDTVYAFQLKNMNCQCKTPNRAPTTQINPVLRFEVVDKTHKSDDVIIKGVTSELQNGKILTSGVKQR